jgi:16S rRNA (guanine(1405)-N(7))-methyltransferase
MDLDLADQLVEQVLAGAKYRTVSPDFIRHIGVAELAKRRNLKEAIKATKNKLHQVGGAYFKTTQNYSAWLEALRTATAAGDRAGFLRVCTQILGAHASTAERLPLLPEFYTTIFSYLPEVHSVIDVACGLNPVSIPWMPLPPDVEYFAYDIYRDMTGFLNNFFSIAGVNGHAETRDVIHACPTQPADVAFILKAVPCLEQVDKAAGARLLDTIKARHLVVSFPIHTLGGKNVGMVPNYETKFQQLLAERAWPAQKIEFATELVFMVAK